MEKNLNSEQQLDQYNERIITLFKIIKQDLKKLSDQYTEQQNLTGLQMLIIDVLFKNQGINLHDLSVQLKMADSNVSVAVDRLVCKGIVLREASEENRRSIRLSLSPEFEGLTYSKNRFGINIIRNATEEELNTIIEGLEKYHDLLKSIHK